MERMHSRMCSSLRVACAERPIKVTALVEKCPEYDASPLEDCIAYLEARGVMAVPVVLAVLGSLLGVAIGFGLAQLIRAGPRGWTRWTPCAPSRPRPSAVVRNLIQIPYCAC